MWITPAPARWAPEARPVRPPPFTFRGVAHEQTYFSAQQHQPPPYPRLPQAQQHQRRSQSSQEPSHTRSMAPGRDRLPEVNGAISRKGAFPKSLRIRQRSEFQGAQRDSRRIHAEWFVVLVSLRSDNTSPGARLGITASRKAGNAVIRNRTKRLVREWFRGAQTRLPATLDLVVICRADLPWLDLSQVESALGRLEGKIKNLAGRSL
jgi:ribonuclease P protein component